MVIQGFLTLCSLFIIAKAFKSYRKRSVRLTTFCAWSLFWIVLIAVVWQPDLTNHVAGILQVGRGADAVLYLSLILIFYLLFRIFEKLEMLDQEITTIVREIAVSQPKKL
ncbi:MAG: DUF2304 family protein [bacterium]|nr:DUF2304 family protein [bacterium]